FRSTLSELKKAHDKGHVSMTDVVNLGGKPTTLGRALIVEHLPPKMSLVPTILNDPKFEVNKSTISDMVTQIAKNHASVFDLSVNHLKDLGTEQSFKHGFSIGLKDFTTLPERDKIISEYKKKADHIHATEADHHKREEKLVDLWGKATQEMDDALKKRAGETRLSTMVYSGVRGKKEQLRQMVA